MTDLEPLRAGPLTALSGVAHGFYGRVGGISLGVYGSLNCGLGSLDDRDHVVENRARVVRDLLSQSFSNSLGLPPLLTAYQVHSADALFVTEAWPVNQRPRVDGLVTRTPQLVLGALSADCAPVLLADGDRGVIGAFHAGWKGALGGIVDSTVKTMVEAGARRAAIVAAIGPTISQASYEVGPDFAQQFLRDDAGLSRFFVAHDVTGRQHFDLPGFVDLMLERAGIETVDRCAACTYKDEQQYFSFRRTTHRRESDYGRQVSTIALR